MSRFKTEIQLNKPESFVDFIIKDFFHKEDFVYKEQKGEILWQNGAGLLTAPQFIKYKYENGLLTLEAWLKFAIIPGVYCGEMGLKGIFGMGPKSMLKKKVNLLISLLSQAIPSDMPIDDFSDNLNTNEPGTLNGQPIQVYAHDTSSKATLSLVFGLVSFSGVFLPLLGVILGALGIVNAKKGLHSAKKGLATAGLVLSIIGIVFSVISWIFNMIYAASTIL